jgi:HK97 family phage major capsid protein
MSDTPEITINDLMTEVKSWKEDNQKKLDSFLRADQLEEIKSELITAAEKKAEAKMEALVRRPSAAGASDTENSEKKAAFLKYLRCGKGELSREEKSLVEDTTGQIIVPEDLEATIYRELPSITVIRKLATVRPTNSDRVRRRSIDSVSTGWGKLETGSTITESSLTPAEAWLYIEDLYGLTKVGEDELADTDVALEGIISGEFARKIAEAEDTGFIVGTGHTNSQPEGILSGGTVTRVNTGQNAKVTLDDFKKLIFAVPAQYRQNGNFVMNSNTILAVSILKDTTGRFLWEPNVQSGFPARLFGFPVYAQEDVYDITDAGTAKDIAIFGDIRSGYQIADRSGMTVQRLNELYAESGLVGFKVHARVGGAVVIPDAMRVLNVIA